MDLVTKPLRLAVSKPARQTLIYTFLVTAATSVLLGIAVFAYTLFYCNFIPQIEIHKAVHLQYGDGPHPYGIIPLGSELVSRQAYDIFLSLNMPRSPRNISRGNFMVTLALLRPLHKFDMSHFQKLGVADIKSPMSYLRAEDILFAFRRPAIMTYESFLVSLTSRILNLPLYVIRFLSEAETLTIGIGESIVFPKGWKNIPSLALLEIQAGQDIQIYDATILFRARFSGLRWLMYNHRIFSFILFTGIFWLSTLVFATLAWTTLSIYSSSKNKPYTKVTNDSVGNPSIKRERTISDEDPEEKTEELTSDDEPDLSDTPHVFPTYGRQIPLRFISKAKSAADETEYSQVDPFVKAEVDDEDQGQYINTTVILKADSGIGTSLSEGGIRSLTKRSNSHQK